jgi:hypothetical protein
MKRSTTKVSLALGLLMGVANTAIAGFPATAVTRCGVDAVVAGTVCLDRYEASVWRVPNPTTTNAVRVQRIQEGVATREDLLAGGATPLDRLHRLSLRPLGERCRGIRS